MKTYLVTGGCGFIGSNFIHYILNKYDDVKVVNLDKLTYCGNLENLNNISKDSRYSFIKGDICDKSCVKKIFKDYDIDYVVNFAAESHVDRSINNPERFILTNVYGTCNMLNCAKESWQIKNGFKKDKKYIQISTDEVYGSLGNSGFFYEDTSINPHSPYSSSKAGADLFVKSYFDTYKMPINITRCSNNYGPYQYPEKLIPLTISKCIKGEKIPLYGDGLNVRDWIYVIDHVMAIDKVINLGTLGEIYNIGSNNEKKNIEIMEKIICYLREKYKLHIDKDLIVYVEDRKGHDRRYAICAEKICRELEWNPKTDFESGIEKTVDWYMNNKEWLSNIEKRNDKK